MLSNPVRWQSRYKNYWRFQQHIEQSGAILYTAEVAYGDREFEVTEPNNPRHLQLRTNDELWHKENALNLVMQRLPADAKFVAWIDADVTFARSDWAQETLHLLQHYDFIQMFSTCQDLDAQDNPMENYLHRGFAYCWAEGLEPPKGTVPDYSGGGRRGAVFHPGYAWAARIDSLSKVGMLIDFAVLGSADFHMAWALVGQTEQRLTPLAGKTYRKWIMEWQRRCDEHIRRNIGYMPGLILHHYHGSKRKRYYVDRWKFLVDADFDPSKDLKRDRQGLWALSGRNLELRDGIRRYARMRDEDD